MAAFGTVMIAGSDECPNPESLIGLTKSLAIAHAI